MTASTRWPGCAAVYPRISSCRASNSQARALIRIGGAGLPYRRRHLPVDGAGTLGQHVAGRGQNRAAGPPFDQRDSDGPFQRGDGSRQGRLCHREPLGGAGDATLIGDRHEIAQLTKIDLGHESSLPCRGGMAFDAEIGLSRRAVAPEESNP